MLSSENRIKITQQAENYIIVRTFCTIDKGKVLHNPIFARQKQLQPDTKHGSPKFIEYWNTYRVAVSVRFFEVNVRIFQKSLSVDKQRTRTIKCELIYAIRQAVIIR